MKKVVAGILSMATVAGMVATSTVVSADQIIDGRRGETSGEVLINGIIGEFDNTKPGPNPDDLNNWINVTLPTQVVFYTTEASNHTEITSVSKQITNNSAVGVITTVSDVKNPVNMDSVRLLQVNDIDLFVDGESSVAEEELFTLEGNQGDNIGNFVFTGEAAPNNASEEVNASFQLVLSFAPDVERN